MGVARVRPKRPPMKTANVTPLKKKTTPKIKRFSGCPLCGGLAWCVRKDQFQCLSGCWQCSHCGESGRKGEKCACRKPFVWNRDFTVPKKPGKAAELVALVYQERIPWQSLPLAERQRYLDRGKLTSSDLTALKELGIDAPGKGK